MEELNEITEAIDKSVKKKDKLKSVVKNDSLQHNSQDLDQEQVVNVNPVQLNSQGTNVYIINGNENLYGSISGITYLNENKKILSNVRIDLFFGSEADIPVFKTNSDNNGNFKIDDLPPGYYTIYAEYSQYMKYNSNYIKVLPGQKVQHSIPLI
jgi:hypothetical protein